MSVRKGVALLQVLVMSMLFMLICVSLAKQTLQSKMLKKKAVSREEATAGMESVLAKVWACLEDAGYPVEGSCRVTPAQRACVPQGVAMDFIGSYPACRVRVSLER